MSMPHHECCTCVECELSRALADRDRRIEALVAEVDSWKASYMALAPDHDVAMLRANSRIEALTKALRDVQALINEYLNGDDEPCEPPCEVHQAKTIVDAALASAAGAEGMATSLCDSPSKDQS